MLEKGSRVEVYKLTSMFDRKTGEIIYVDNPMNWDPPLPAHETYYLVRLDDPTGLCEDSGITDTIPGISEKGSVWFREEELQLEVREA